MYTRFNMILATVYCKAEQNSSPNHEKIGSNPRKQIVMLVFELATIAGAA